MPTPQVHHRQNEQILQLKEALGRHAIREEFDYPGDAPEFCGWWCGECKNMVEADASGHASDCLLNDVAPSGSRADNARATKQEVPHE